MPQSRSVVQAMRDFLTSPLRIDVATWEAIEAAAGHEKWATVWNVLTNPAQAKPEDLETFSERMGVTNGVAKFLIDTATNPALIMDVGFTQGASALGFWKKEGPSVIGKMAQRDFGQTSQIAYNTESYGTILQKQNFPEAANAALIANSRRNSFESEFLSKYQKIRDDYIILTSRDKWIQAQQRIAMTEHMQEIVPGWRPAEGWTALDESTRTRLRSEFWNPLYDKISTLEKLGQGVARQEFLQDPGQYMSVHVDPMQVGLVANYLPRVMTDEGVLNYSDEMLNRLVRKANGGTIEQLRAMGKVTSDPYDLNVPADANFHPAAAVQRKWATIQQWAVGEPGGKRFLNPYLQRRSADEITQEMVEKGFNLNLDALATAYVRKASTSYALEVPLTAEEALQMYSSIDPSIHGALREGEKRWQNLVQPEIYDRLKNNSLQTSRMYEINTERRELIESQRAGIISPEQLSERLDILKEETQKMFEALPFEQRSLGLQLRALAAERWPGFDPMAQPGTLGHYKTPATAAHWTDLSRDQYRLQAGAFSHFMDAMYGKQRIEKFYLARAMAGMFGTLSKAVDGPVAAALDKTGQLFGKPDVGNRLVQWLGTNSDVQSAAGIERMLVNYTYLNALGFRPAAALINLTQTPMVTYPTIGLANTLHGVAEATRRMSTGLVAGMRRYAAGDSIGTALREEMNKAMPELLQAGLVGDLRSMEVGAQNILHGKWTNFSDTAMGLFSGAEVFNRATAFYGGRQMLQKILTDNPTAFGVDIATVSAAEREALLNFHSGKIAYQTQFGTNPARMTPLQSKYLQSPSLRQFSTYPLAFKDWLFNAAYRGAMDVRTKELYGTIEKLGGEVGRQDWLSKSLPYLRYTVAANGLANFGRDILNIDLGEKVTAGAFPIPFDDQMFGILPVPVIPGMVANSIQATAEGNLQKMNPTEIPWVGQIPIPRMLFPFGLAFSQFGRMVNQTKGNLLEDRQGRGVSDIDEYGKFLLAMGFSTADSARDELKAKQLMNMNNRLKDYRLRLAQAAAAGDPDVIAGIRQQYANDSVFSKVAQFAPLSVTRKDVQRVRDQADTDRLTRMLRTTAPFIRDNYGFIDPTNDPAGFHSVLTGPPAMQYNGQANMGN